MSAPLCLAAAARPQPAPAASFPRGCFSGPRELCRAGEGCAAGAGAPQPALLYLEHHAAVVAVARRVTDDPDLAEDVAQETFLRLLQAGAPSSRVRGWLLGMARNIAIDCVRRRRIEMRSLARYTREAERDAAFDPLPETGAADHRKARLDRALALLPLRDRALLSLYSQGFPHREIAARVGTTIGSVSTMLRRARGRVQRLLREADSAAMRQRRGVSPGRFGGNPPPRALTFPTPLRPP